jgi:hypothetical protein
MRRNKMQSDDVPRASASLSPIHHRCHYFLLLRRARKRRYGRLS